MSVPKSTAVCRRRQSLRFSISASAKSPTCFRALLAARGDEGQSTARELVQEVTENEETADDRMKEKGRQTGANLQRLALSRRGCSFPFPLAPICACGDFSFFGTRPSLCLFQYALLALYRPLAPVMELHFST